MTTWRVAATVVVSPCVFLDGDLLTLGRVSGWFPSVLAFRQPDSNWD